MSGGVCAVAADTRLETPEGALTMRSLARRAAPVLTRDESGAVCFTMVSAPRLVAEGTEVWTVRIDNGASLRVGPEQVLLARGMREVEARDLRPGDALEVCFAYPAGYVFRDSDGGEHVSDGCAHVEAVEPGGTADVYSFEVTRSGRFLFAAGVLGRAGGR